MYTPPPPESKWPQRLLMLAALVGFATSLYKAVHG